ncbi:MULTISPECIES: CvpA family protein [Enterococcus]|uniref:Colicin V production protein CvpA n=1 Tax=Enterococcus dispar ATCC 51266 TaxID=1139219 RepID=S0KV87_9ENTE|nr:CvpA family protein [Enterococcus dispar]EOT44048.1 hypothetical protein OMK_00191 [Enterococcus dispar ATCC 51266]EOW85695.1 hypothetical protein I569_01011 [Enterococcus dispar ATCC 51266]MCU7358069.1 CvpA family protein [Enterococcus dispar]WCG32824.1 CvpA family protein [Enterococcus dispar]
MIGLLIILILVIAFYIGGRRGAPLQLAYTLGYFLSFAVACFSYQSLAKKLELFVPYPSVTPDAKMVFYSQNQSLDLDKAYYAAVAFLLVMFIGWLITSLIVVFLNNLRFKRLLENYDWVLGGLFNVLTAYVVIFFVLFVLAMIPLATVQNIFRDHFSARMIVEHSFILSWLFKNLWVTSILG